MPGRYCGQCGERRVGPGDLRLRRYLGEAAHVLTDADSRFLRSFRALILRPGRLTADYVAGRRRPYLLPLQLFLVANIAFFLVQPISGVDTFTTPLRTHMTGVPYRALATTLVEGRLAEEGTELSEFSARFDATIRGQARTLVIVMVPLLVPFLLVAFPRRRVPAAQHLVFSTHFFAFIMVLLVVWSLLIAAAFQVGVRAPPDIQRHLQWFLGDDVQSLLLAGFIAAYAVPAVRTAYGTGLAGAVTRGLLFPVALLVVLNLYRFILFFTTLIAM